MSFNEPPKEDQTVEVAPGEIFHRSALADFLRAIGHVPHGVTRRLRLDADMAGQAPSSDGVALSSRTASNVIKVAFGSQDS